MRRYTTPTVTANITGIDLTGMHTFTTLRQGSTIVTLENLPVTVTENGKAEGPKGDPGEPGAPGSDYVLTNQDKQDIAAIVDAEAVKYVSQTLTDAQKTQARANIGAASLSDLGTVFTLKGGVATVSDLPATGNNIGDVYYVENLSAGFIWITSTAYPNGYWEELGETVDLSNYIEKPSAPASGQILQWNGTSWVAASLPLYDGSVT